MVPSKSYCFLRASNVNDAQRIYSGLHGRSHLAQNGGPLYLSYCDRVPSVPSTWDGPLPEGLLLIEDFVDEQEAQDLMAACLPAALDDEDESSTVNGNALKHRQVRHFGYAFQYGSNDVNPQKPLADRPIPSVCSALWPRLQQHLATDAPAFHPDQLTVNAYAPGQGIPPHVDTHSPFAEPIASLSLGESGVVMDFRRGASNGLAELQRSVWLPPRSLLLMQGAARYGWTHGITPRHMDVVPAELNGSQTRSGTSGGGCLTVRRRAELRVSLTFRQLRNAAAAGPCRCAYAELCDSAKKEATEKAAAAAMTATPSCAARLEQENVHRVYETIAGHFSETRHSPWPQVQQFVRSLEAGAVLADIGCGNGKYLVQDAELCCLGGDRSANLLSVCRERGLNVFRCDCLQVPLRDGVADGCICIAVVHHLATEVRRRLG